MIASNSLGLCSNKARASIGLLKDFAQWPVQKSTRINILVISQLPSITKILRLDFESVEKLIIFF
jgi:hypothetical protein